jgi:Protein phosphatase 2C
VKGIVEIAAGTVTGRDHSFVGKNNQDALAFLQNDHVTIAIVCDGCGSGNNSEVGAQKGARVLVGLLAKAVQIFGEIVISEPEYVLESVRQRALDIFAHEIDVLSGDMSRTETVNDYLLFTVVGTLITRWGCVTFSVGDGVIAVNGQISKLGPFPENEPPYLLYGLGKTTLSETDPQLLRFNIHRIISNLNDFDSILIGSDGVGELIEREHRHLPGSQEIVGPLEQFWKDQAYFLNPDKVRRKLALINREVTRADWAKRTLRREPGLLSDDTTLVTIRRILRKE